MRSSLSRRLENRRAPLTALFLVAVCGCVVPAQSLPVMVGGGISLNLAVSPWGTGVSDWTAPAVRPGDLLVFRWFGETHDVQKFGDPVTYGLCSFFNTKQVSPARPVGVRTYTVKAKDKGRILYFASSVGSDCANGIKVAIRVR
ncbi:hypothetical protein CLOM_g1178 [Closterium sp. NIES-68]|nr:hypothetical protein CLOM_g1178 [Closterium sp. NIES-68]GJP65288.1 hypothetical protein CLOP_g22191 [Closterium sp. NIES-67]